MLNFVDTIIGYFGLIRRRPRGPYRDLKMAIIADEFTRNSLSYECHLVDLTPYNYLKVLKEWNPDVLFVESAWQGARNLWKYKIAAYPDHPERTNEELRRVVNYAGELGIPCVFWNKEDGVHFERFISSASLFNYIFTVDNNCMELYRKRLGRDVSVKTLMFAVQPSIHYPAPNGHKENRACFLGSYSNHIHERRRHWQNMLFGASSEIGLTIFDRNSNRRSKIYRYPQLSGVEIRNRVKYHHTAEIYRRYLVSLNVNTIEDSDTMFSRRLIEIMASGGLAVTTPAKSVDKYFKNYCHVVSNEKEGRELFQELKKGWRSSDIEMVNAGAEYILQNHTWAHRIESVLETIGKA